ncbi:unnamed protein product [Bemisia tabaci]|uniref:Uncharacterized protein n=1 Tax=Bemisia tabaci TaxID=7038 RepID=A0A9P0A3H4_BEMTA|nr:unnamed protein product [Bemisia tabaci]
MCPELEKQASSVEGNAVCLKVYKDSNCNDATYVGDVFDLKLGGYTNFKEFPAYANLQDTIYSVEPCSNTTVTFFEQNLLRGTNCTIQMRAGCQNLCPELNNNFRSFAGQTDCVKMWTEANCKGRSNNYPTFPPANSRFGWTAASVEDCVATDGDKSLTRPLNVRRPTTGLA